MNGSRKIVVLGLMTKIPVAGVVWQTAHYMLGLRQLGFDPYYVEAHARTPSMLMRRKEDDGGRLAAEFIDRALARFGFSDRWAYEALHADGRCYGLSASQLHALLDRAELVINLHGGTEPRAEHFATGRLVYLETDPVQLALELAEERPDTIEFLERHCAFFTFAENWWSPDCKLPVSDRFEFRPTRQPVCADLWDNPQPGAASRFTTIGNWRQQWRDVVIDGRTYTWSKHSQFERHLELPRATGLRFELALAACDEQARQMLRAHDWEVIDAARVSGEPDVYRTYIKRSLAEFTVAKEQNTYMRSGWFSDRSATYLAAGRPVVTQETGFSNVLPTGCGLHAFASFDQAVAAVEHVYLDYRRQSAGARAVASEFFDAGVVLRRMLMDAGVAVDGARSAPPLLTRDLTLTPVSRRPLRLCRATVDRIGRAAIPAGARQAGPERLAATVIVVSHDSLALTRMCVESVLANTAGGFQLIVVDNGSKDGSRTYLRTIERRFAHVQTVLNERNVGFPAGCNQGLAAARGDLLVLLNNDTIVAPEWLDRLRAHVDRGGALVGPVTNRIGNEAEVDVDYGTYGEFLNAAAERARRHDGQSFEIPMPAMFCLAMSRDAFGRLGRLDEQYGLGTLEDDDYAERARGEGLRCVCAEDVLVHHFGEGSLGRLYASGVYGSLIETNRRRFESKWGKPWRPYDRRPSSDYEAVRSRIRETVAERLPARGAVLVVSHGDEELVALGDRIGWHFPQTAAGVYAGHHPANGPDAVAQLELMRDRGARYLVLPQTSLWWLDHYRELRAHLAERYRELLRDDACVVFDLALREDLTTAGDRVVLETEMSG